MLGLVLCGAARYLFGPLGLAVTSIPLVWFAFKIDKYWLVGTEIDSIDEGAELLAKRHGLIE